MLQQYIASGFYVDDCGNGLQPPVTGYAIYTGYTNYYDSYNKAYCLAIANAALLRESSPCIASATTTSTTTTTNTTTSIPYGQINNTYHLYNWTGDFTGINNSYYDIVSWGSVNGYLSGNTYGSNYYFSSLSTADYGNNGVVLAIIHGSGIVTGFGDNSRNQLDIPNNLTGVKQISIGYDHCVALLNNGNVTGWGRDNWGALNINASLSNVIKVQAGIGSTVVLFGNGQVTGTNTIGGGKPINYPIQTGYKDISFSYNHILLIDISGYITGIGSNLFGESNLRQIINPFKIFAGNGANSIVYNGGYVSGYGTDQSLYRTPNVNNSGIDFQLKSHIGSILLRNQNILQWVDPWTDESINIIKPSYLQNNIVAISQSDNFTAAIYKRYINTSNNITGNLYVWQITDIDGQSYYGGLYTGDRFSGQSYVVQPCDGYSFQLPSISNTGTSYVVTNVPNCGSGVGYHTITFNSIYNQKPMININYTNWINNTMTGFAATGITTSDYWNQIIFTDRTGKNLLYSNGELSNISGGHIYAGTGSGLMFAGINNMYGTYISGISGSNMRIYFTSFPIGKYKMLVYGHGSGSGRNSEIIIFTNNIFNLRQYTSSGVNYNSLPWTTGIQYVQSDFSITHPNNYIHVQISGFINGIQIVPV